MKELIVHNYPKSSVTEAIKAVRTNLRFSSVNDNIQTILITSSVAGEGKSFVAANLASAYATNTENVLLIDCDLRRGRQKALFDMHGTARTGLSNLLIDPEWEKNLDSYIKKTEVPNLDVITTGSTPPNPSVLLESEKIEKVVEKLRKKYNFIIFDTPPVGGITDALVMTRLADIVLIVASTKKTTMELLENTKESLDNVNANVAGVILNRVDKKDSRYYSSYYYYQS